MHMWLVGRGGEEERKERAADLGGDGGRRREAAVELAATGSSMKPTAMCSNYTDVFTKSAYKLANSTEMIQ